MKALGLGALTALIKGDYRQADALAKATLEMCRRLGIGHYISACLATLSASASLQRRSIRAIRLWAAFCSLREAIGIPSMPAELSLYEPYVQAARAQLDDAAWEAARKEGRAISMEQAVEYALTEQEPTLPTTVSVPEEPPAGKRGVGLTHREEEVAALVARGLTNRQIATELSVSKHTVANHVAKILRKLELDSRSQISAWVVERRTSP